MSRRLFLFLSFSPGVYLRLTFITLQVCHIQFVKSFSIHAKVSYGCFLWCLPYYFNSIQFKNVSYGLCLTFNISSPQMQSHRSINNILHCTSHTPPVFIWARHLLSLRQVTHLAVEWTRRLIELGVYLRKCGNRFTVRNKARNTLSIKSSLGPACITSFDYLANICVTRFING